MAKKCVVCDRVLLPMEKECPNCGWRYERDYNRGLYTDHYHTEREHTFRYKEKKTLTGNSNNNDNMRDMEESHYDSNDSRMNKRKKGNETKLIKVGVIFFVALIIFRISSQMIKNFDNHRVVNSRPSYVEQLKKEYEESLDIVELMGMKYDEELNDYVENEENWEQLGEITLMNLKSWYSSIDFYTTPYDYGYIMLYDSSLFYKENGAYNRSDIYNQLSWMEDFIEQKGRNYESNFIMHFIDGLIDYPVENEEGELYEDWLGQYDNNSYNDWEVFFEAYKYSDHIEVYVYYYILVE